MKESALLKMALPVFAASLFVIGCAVYPARPAADVGAEVVVVGDPPAPIMEEISRSPGAGKQHRHHAAPPRNTDHHFATHKCAAADQFSRDEYAAVHQFPSHHKYAAQSFHQFSKDESCADQSAGDKSQACAAQFVFV